MLLASQKTIEQISESVVYGNAAVVNVAVILASGSRVPCYAINGKRAYRIWVCKCTDWWFQRHEWISDGKNSTDFEPWILQGYYPRKQFEKHMMPVDANT